MGGLGNLNQRLENWRFLYLSWHLTYIVFSRTRVYFLSCCAHWLPSCLPSLVAVITRVMFLRVMCRCGDTLEVFLRTGPALIAWIVIVQFHPSLVNSVVCYSHCLSLGCASPPVSLDFDFFLVPLLDLFALIRPPSDSKSPDGLGFCQLSASGSTLSH